MTVYEAAGEATLREIVADFYRQVPEDEILGPMYPAEALAAAEQRLCGFIIYRFGGPQTYIEERGHPRLRMRHAAFRIDQAARDRWVELMDAAIARQDLAEEIATPIREFLHESATFLINVG
ncbi:MAG: hemin transporter [Planctomycetaceae bacterium]|nr:hemin transporter [Planctomycetaceae bacterium]